MSSRVLCLLMSIKLLFVLDLHTKYKVKVVHKGYCVVCCVIEAT